MCCCGCAWPSRILALFSLLPLATSLVFLLASAGTSAVVIGPWLVSIGATLCVVTLEVLPACACGICARYAHASRGCARSHCARLVAYGALGTAGLMLGGGAAATVAALMAATLAQSAQTARAIVAPPTSLTFAVFATAWALVGFAALWLAAICAGVALLRSEAGPFASSSDGAAAAPTPLPSPSPGSNVLAKPETTASNPFASTAGTAPALAAAPEAAPALQTAAFGSNPFKSSGASQRVAGVWET